MVDGVLWQATHQFLAFSHSFYFTKHTVTEAIPVVAYSVSVCVVLVVPRLALKISAIQLPETVNYF